MDTGRPKLFEVIRWMEIHAAGATMPGTTRMLRAAIDYLRECRQEQWVAEWYDIGAHGCYCSGCHHRAPAQTNYCPHCGAKMIIK